MDDFEYRLMYEHLASIRECVTNFTGYVLGGSGVLVTILGVIANPAIAGLVAIIGSILVTMIALVILYKCNSHNRISGYLKVIEHERIDRANAPKNLMLWEVCIGRLHHYSRKRGTWAQIGESLNHLSDVSGVNHAEMYRVIQYLLRQNSPIDYRRKLKGGWIVLRAMGGSVSTESWVYPAYIAAIHLVLVFLLVAGGGFLLFTSQDLAPQYSNLLLPGFLLVASVQAICWFLYAGKLHDLIDGSSSVDSFFWRFLTIRNHVLKELGHQIEYPLTASWLTRMNERVERRVEQVTIDSPFFTKIE